MKKILLFIFYIFYLHFFSQTNLFVYELKFKTDSLSSELKKAIIVLQVDNEKIVKEYEYRYFINDSINKININGNVTKLSPKVNDIALVRKYKSNLNKNYRYIDQDYYVFESIDMKDWDLCNEYIYLDGYKLQKASTLFGGRIWEAWFCKDIQIEEGPYKFNGLPGLVFWVYDQKKNYEFKLLKNLSKSINIDTNNFLETFYGNKAILIDELTYQKRLIEYFDNPIQKNIDGSPISRTPTAPCSTAPTRSRCRLATPLH